MKSRYNIEFPSLTRVKAYINTFHAPSLIKVTQNSPLLLRKSVHVCARYFHREGYSGFIHYDLHYDNCISYLFTTDDSYPHAIGACCFRIRQYSDIPKEIWSMHWIWIHPYERNKGILSLHKETFDKTFGYWYPEPYHSNAMTAFIKKHGMLSPEERFGILEISNK